MKWSMYGGAPMQSPAEGGEIEDPDDPEVAEIMKWLRMMRQQGGGGEAVPLPSNSFQTPNNATPIAWGEEKGGGGGGGGNFFSKLMGMFGGGG